MYGCDKCREVEKIGRLAWNRLFMRRELSAHATRMGPHYDSLAAFRRRCPSIARAMQPTICVSTPTAAEVSTFPAGMPPQRY